MYILHKKQISQGNILFTTERKKHQMFKLRHVQFEEGEKTTTNVWYLF